MIPEGSIIIEGNYRHPDGDLRRGQIKVVDGIIEGVGPDLGRLDVIYDDSFEIYPGFIDVHVHGREYPHPWIPTEEEARKYAAMTSKEDFVSVSQAAINGGVACIGLMPNDPFPPTDFPYYNAKQKLAKIKCSVDNFLYALIDSDTDPSNNMVQGCPMGDVPLRGVPWKLYTHDLSRSDIKRVLTRFKGLDDDPVIAVHAESRELLEKDPSRPAEAEVESIRQVLDIALALKLRVHITHVSTGEGLEKIVEAKRYSDKITCETTPTYLYFSDKNKHCFEMSKYLFMKPPFRTEHDRRRLLEGLVKGDIDMLATDHAPHTLKDKDEGQFGIPLIDHYTNFVGWMLQNGVSPKRVQEACAEKPAEIFGKYLKGSFGKIAPGYVGSLTVVGKAPPENLDKQAIRTKCGWSPFKGSRLGDGHLLYAKETFIRGVPMKQALYDQVA